MINEDKALRDKLRNYESPVSKDLWNRIQAAQTAKKRTPLAGFLNGRTLGLLSIAVVLVTGAYLFYNSPGPHGVAASGGTDAVAMTAARESQSQGFSENAGQGLSTSTQTISENQEFSTSSAAPQGTGLPSRQTAHTSNRHAVRSQPVFLTRQLTYQPAKEDKDGTMAVASNYVTIPSETDQSIGAPMDAGSSMEAIDLLSSEAAINQQSPWETNRKSRIKTKRSGKSTYTIDLLGGMGGWTSSMKLRDGFNNVNLDRRKETEIPLYATSLTLRTALIQPSGFAIYGGISYSQLIDLFEYNYRTLAPSPTDPNELVPGNRLKKTYNRFHQIDIPIGAGYEFKWKRWSLAMKGGVAVNVYAWQKGEILLPGALDPTSITTGDPASANIYRNNTGFQGWASIGLQKNVGPGSQIMIEPYLSQHINSLTLSDYALSQRPMRFGIQLGLRKLFFSTRQRTCY